MNASPAARWTLPCVEVRRALDQNPGVASSAGGRSPAHRSVGTPAVGPVPGEAVPADAVPTTCPTRRARRCAPRHGLDRPDVLRRCGHRGQLLVAAPRQRAEPGEQRQHPQRHRRHQGQPPSRGLVGEAGERRRECDAALRGREALRRDEVESDHAGPADEEEREPGRGHPDRSGCAAALPGADGVAVGQATAPERHVDQAERHQERPAEPGHRTGRQPERAAAAGEVEPGERPPRVGLPRHALGWPAGVVVAQAGDRRRARAPEAAQVVAVDALGLAGLDVEHARGRGVVHAVDPQLQHALLVLGSPTPSQTPAGHGRSRSQPRGDVAPGRTANVAPSTRGAEGHRRAEPLPGAALRESARPPPDDARPPARRPITGTTPDRRHDDVGPVQRACAGRGRRPGGLPAHGRAGGVRAARRRSRRTAVPRPAEHRRRGTGWGSPPRRPARPGER